MARFAVVEVAAADDSATGVQVVPSRVTSTVYRVAPEPLQLTLTGSVLAPTVDATATLSPCPRACCGAVTVGALAS